jgi:HTH-type transcriptional regulator/antitoxin HigA
MTNDMPIADEEEYVEALAEVSRLMDLPEGSPEAAGLERLAERVQAYEAIHYPMGDE